MLLQTHDGRNHVSLKVVCLTLWVSRGFSGGKKVVVDVEGK
jgi:hypothetical protein